MENKSFSKLLQLTDLKNDQIFEIVQFKKLINFPNLTFSKIKEKNIKCYNLENLRIINFTI